VLSASDGLTDLGAEIHLQPQVDAEFPDGLALLVHVDIPDSLRRAGAGPPMFFGFPQELGQAPTEKVLGRENAGGWLMRDSVSECGFTVRGGEESQLPELAQTLDEKLNVVMYTPTSMDCDFLTFQIRLSDVLSGVYETSSYKVGLRLPPIAFFSSTANSEGAENSAVTPASPGPFGWDNCELTTIQLDTYGLQATEWIGANEGQVVTPYYRTAALFYGGTSDRPVSWIAASRPPESGQLAPCVTQGVGMDLDKQNATSRSSFAQIQAGFLFGLAAGFVTPLIDSATQLVRLRSTLKNG
jgi:hypothetical protein